MRWAAEPSAWHCRSTSTSSSLVVPSSTKKASTFCFPGRGSHHKAANLGAQACVPVGATRADKARANRSNLQLDEPLVVLVGSIVLQRLLLAQVEELKPAGTCSEEAAY